MIETLTFGKYKGWSLRKIAGHDASYLLWLSSKPNLNSNLRAAIKETLDFHYDCMDYEPEDDFHPGNPRFYGDS